MELFPYEPGEDDGRKEELHQIDVASYIAEFYPHLNFFHVPNESGVKSSAGFIEKRRRMGVKKGVSDNQILTRTRCGTYPFTVMELKAPAKRKKTSEDQDDFGAKVERDGGLFVVCWGYKAAKRFLQKYY